MMEASCRKRQEASIMSRQRADGRYEFTLNPLTLNVWPPP